MTNAPNLVHEADAQRHHVRVKLPAQIEINGKSYAMSDWSTGGAQVKLPAQADPAVFADSKVHKARLVFDIAGFSIVVPMTVELRHVENKSDGGLMGLRYIDMTKEQIVIMQHLVSSYVTGTLTSVDDIIHVMSRNNFTKARQIPKREEKLTPGEKTSLMIKRLAVPVVSILLLTYIFFAMFEQSYIISAEKAVITGSGMAVIAPAGGVVNFQDLNNGDMVKKGDVMMTILSETGTTTGVDSPCDCVIEERPVDAGTMIGKGTVVLRLIPLDAPLRVEAYVPYEEAIRLSKGQMVLVRLPGDHDKYSGTISSITIGTQAEARAKVTISADEALPSALVGTPVSVKINTASSKAGE